MKIEDFFKLINKGVETIMMAEMRNSVNTSPDQVYLAITWWRGGYHAITSWDYDKSQSTLFINCSKEELKCINYLYSKPKSPLPFYINENAVRAEDVVKKPVTLDQLTKKTQSNLDGLLSCSERCNMLCIKHVLLMIDDEPVKKITDINPRTCYIIRNDRGTMFMVFSVEASYSYNVTSNEEAGMLECAQRFHERYYELDSKPLLPSERPASPLDNLKLKFIDNYSDSDGYDCGSSAG